MFARTRNSIAVALLTSAVLGWSAAPSQAQNPGLPPTFGSADFLAGTKPLPVFKDLTAGGKIKTNLGGNQAFVSNAPDFRLNHAGGGFRLSFFVTSTKDTTLLINLPDGKWVSNDDRTGTTNPRISIFNPPAGRYDVYVGTFGPTPAPARLVVSQMGEVAPAKAPPTAAEVPTPSLNPTSGSVSLKSGFSFKGLLPDAFLQNVGAGGSIKTNLGGVPAFVSKAPAFRLNYTKGSHPLVIRAKSESNTTLLINLPNGEWIATDDGLFSRNPRIIFNAPQSGRYDIYVGTAAQGAEQAKLLITEW